MILPKSFHTPVLFSQVIEALKITPGKKYIDATLGGGGYGLEILKRGGIVLGLDRDQDAINYVREKSEEGKCLPAGKAGKIEEKGNLFLVQGNFADLKEIAHSKGFEKVAGIIFDLGMSSYQLENSGRGFSYQKDEPLDMRMDRRQKETAADLINNLSKEALYEIFTKYAEELHSRAIADAVVRARSVKGEITSTSELAQIISDVLERIYSGDNKFRNLQGTKARIFQSLRIAVNDELVSLEKGLIQAFELLEEGGRIAILSYHSLEDRIVKLFFKKEEKQGKLKVMTASVLMAERKERIGNPKAKSAKLRIIERLI